MPISHTYAAYAILALVNVGVSYVLLVFVANNLSKDDYALYGALTTVMSLALIIANFGHKEAVYKFAAKRNFDELSKVVSSFITWSLLFLGVALLTLLIDFTIGVAALSFCALLYLTTASAYNRGLSKYISDAIALPIYRSIWLLGGVGVSLYVVQLTTDHIFLAAFFAALLTFLVVGGYRFSLNAFRKSSEFVLPWNNSTLVKFLMIEFATIVYLKVDMLLLVYFGVEQTLVADYFLSIQILEAAVMLLTPISYFFFNQYAKNREARNQEGGNAHKSVFKYIVILTGLAAVGHFTWYVGGEWLLAAMFNKYIDSFEITLFLLFSLYPLVANIILSNYMILKHKEKNYMMICFLGLMVSVLLNALFIPLWEINGAVISRIVTEAIIVLLLFVYFRRSRFALRDSHDLV